MNLDEVRARLQTRAEEAAGDDEKAAVTIAARSDMPAWQVEVSWIRLNGQCEWTGFAEGSKTSRRTLLYKSPRTSSASTV
jgi:hypothetical protein